MKKTKPSTRTKTPEKNTRQKTKNKSLTYDAIAHAATAADAATVESGGVERHTRPAHRSKALYGVIRDYCWIIRVIRVIIRVIRVIRVIVGLLLGYCWVIVGLLGLLGLLLDY